MMKLILWFLTVLSVGAIRPQPEFTLRSPEQMAKPLPSRGRHMPEHLKVPDITEYDDVKLQVDFPHGDPKPKRPPRPQPARIIHATDEDSLTPIHEDGPLPGFPPEAPRISENGRHEIRGLHTIHDVKDGEDTILPFPQSKPPPSHLHKPKPPVLGSGKPKPEPKAKPEPNRKTKPLVQERDLDMIAFDTQQQCQLDFARLCSPMSSYAPLHQMPRPHDAVVVDFVVVDQMDTLHNSGGNDDGDNDDDDNDDGAYDDDAYDDDAYDDDAYDDDSDVVVFRSPLLDLVQNLFASFTFPRPMQPQARLESATDRAPMYTSRSLRQMGRDIDPVDVSIGFGFEGDMCLLDNSDLLSPQCRASINELQAYADDMDIDDDSGCHILPFILLLLLFTLLLRCVARRRMQKRQDSLHKTLAAIHASPELKAKVEAASGIPVPPTLPACRAKAAMVQQPWYVKMCCLVGLLGASFLIAMTAMLITGAIVNGIYDNDSDDDNASPIVVLAILFSVLTVEVLLVKRLRMAICAYLDTPVSNTTASSGTSSNGGGVNRGFRLPEVFQRMRSVQISSLLPSRSRSLSSSSSGPQYEPLLSEEDRDDTEVMMVQVPASAPPALVGCSRVSTIPVVVSPIDAPSNVQSSISML